jgi:hypothetical protein
MNKKPERAENASATGNIDYVRDYRIGYPDGSVTELVRLTTQVSSDFNERKFLFLFLLSKHLRCFVVFQLCFALGAQEMEVNGVENHAAIRRITTHVGKMFTGDVATAQDYHVETSSIKLEVVAYGLCMGMVHDLDPSLP